MNDRGGAGAAAGAGGLGLRRGRRRLIVWLAGMGLGAATCGASAAEPEGLQYPLAVVAAENGDVFLADRNLPGVWRLREGKLEVFFQGSKQFRTPLNAVRCLAVDGDGRLLAGDSATREVYRFDAEGKPQPLTNGFIGIPMALAVRGDGTILVADLEAHRVWSAPSGGGEPQPFVAVPAPRGLALDSQERLWIVSHGDDQVLRADPDGTLTPVVRGRPFGFPHHVALDDAGNAYVTDGYGKCVWRVPPEGAPEKLASGEPLANPVGLCRQGEGLLVADPHARAAFRLPWEGKLERLVPR